MEIVFFVARPEEAQAVASSADLPGDPAAEPIAVDSPEGLVALGAALGTTGAVLRPLRDATCRSYPVWILSRALCERLARLDDEELDAVAGKWQPGADADWHERASCLGELRDGLSRKAPDERLFALLEERAF